ncbi:MAG: lysophospholipase [Blastocatellia bacterium]|nr:lysophospholipase [Blastocatellia bacterium]
MAQSQPKSARTRKWLTRIGLGLFLAYAVLTAEAAYLLPDLLLKSWLPRRSAAEIERFHEKLIENGSYWTTHPILGGEHVPITLHWLHRPRSKGVAIHLHGFGDDAWGGSSPRVKELSDWDALVFTFRGRDQHPEVACTLGAWERFDVVAAVAFLEAQHIPRTQMVLVGNSMGAGVSLLALRELEKNGGPLAGALLESPFRDLHQAADDHIRYFLGPVTFLAVPAIRIGLYWCGKKANFNPAEVSPCQAAQGLKTPVAMVTGDADDITPVESVREIGKSVPDLTIIPGACHMCAGGWLPGGWGAWAHDRLDKWQKK